MKVGCVLSLALVCFWHIINLQDVGYDASIFDLFPPEKFPEVFDVFTHGDPLHGYPNYDPSKPVARAIDPYDSEDEDERNRACVPMLAPDPVRVIPLPLPGWESDQSKAEDEILEKEYFDIMHLDVSDSPPLHPLTQNHPTGLTYPHSASDLTLRHRILAMGYFGYKTTAQVTSHDVQDVMDMLTSTSSGSGSADTSTSMSIPNSSSGSSQASAPDSRKRSVQQQVGSSDSATQQTCARRSRRL